MKTINAINGINGVGSTLTLNYWIQAESSEFRGAALLKLDLFIFGTATLVAVAIVITSACVAGLSCDCIK
jgi:hypothetical protein